MIFWKPLTKDVHVLSTPKWKGHFPKIFGLIILVNGGAISPKEELLGLEQSWVG